MKEFSHAVWMTLSLLKPFFFCDRNNTVLALTWLSVGWFLWDLKKAYREHKQVQRFLFWRAERVRRRDYL